MADEICVELNSSSQRSTRSVDERIAGIAGRQHGIVTRRQLLALGLKPADIGYRMRIGRLSSVHPRRGVYAVGHIALSLAGRRFAAVAAGGSGSFASYRGAAAVLSVLPPRAAFDVTSPGAPRPLAGVRFHRAWVPADERTVVDGIPTTGLARTLLDLAAVEGRETLERALREAHYLRLTDRLSLSDLIERYAGRPGTAVARAVLAAGAYAKGRHRSPLEDAFSKFCRTRNVELPETNAWLQIEGRWFEVDCLWRRERVALELDGRVAHDNEESFESDRERDLILMAAGWITGRITSRQLEIAPDALECRIRAALTRGAALAAP